MNLIMKSKVLKVLYYGQAVSSLSPFRFLHFLQCVVKNKEYIIVSSLRSGGTDMGICSFKKRPTKIIRFKKEIVFSVSLFFWT